jgi:hypothetical protein
VKPYLEYSTLERADGVAQVVECLCRKCEALSSNPSTTHTKREYAYSRFLKILIVHFHVALAIWIKLHKWVFVNLGVLLSSSAILWDGLWWNLRDLLIELQCFFLEHLFPPSTVLWWYGHMTISLSLDTEIPRIWNLHAVDIDTKHWNGSFLIAVPWEDSLLITIFYIWTASLILSFLCL